MDGATAGNLKKRFINITDEEMNGMSFQEYEIHKEKSKIILGT